MYRSLSTVIQPRSALRKLACTTDRHRASDIPEHKARHFAFGRKMLQDFIYCNKYVDITGTTSLLFEPFVLRGQSSDTVFKE